MTSEPNPIASAQATRTVAVADLADELGVYKQSIFRIAKRLDVQTVKRREPTRGNQLIALVSEAGATAIRDAVAQGRRGGVQSVSDVAEFAPDEGWFYLIQLEPEHDSGRLKVGFTTDLDGRLRHHRCSAPFAVYRKTWPCRRTWERAAVDSMTTGLEQLHTEVFRGPCLDEVVERGDRFFSVMPSVRVVLEADDEQIPTEPRAG